MSEIFLGFGPGGYRRTKCVPKVGDRERVAKARTNAGALTDAEKAEIERFRVQFIERFGRDV